MAKLGEIIHFDITTHSPSGGFCKNADEIPKFYVLEEDTDTPLISASGMTLRSGFVGLYRGKFEATTVNGFEAGKFYDVVVSGMVETVSALTVALNFYMENNSFDTLPTATGIWNVSGRIASGVPIYYADIKFLKDDVGGVDEYTVQWFRNDTPCSSGDITSPQFEVYERTNGAFLIGPTVSMDYVSTGLGTLKYDQQSQTYGVGETNIAKAIATIDGQQRVWYRIFGRDSTV